jgi:hypothetical protein
MFKKFLLLLLVVFAVLQLFRPRLDNTAGATGTAGINNHVSVPQHVDQLLKTSCYDCHSNTTTYPWYASLQPVGWWLDDHISEGKKELNFDEYGNYNLRRKYHKLEEIAELVEENEMPLSSYTLVHNDAKLTGDQKKLLVDWTSKAMNDMKAKYPIDSLIRKKQ